MKDFFYDLLCLFSSNPLASTLFGLISMFFPLLFSYLQYKNRMKPILEETQRLESNLEVLTQTKK